MSKKTDKLVTTLAHKWVDILGLGHWDLTFHTSSVSKFHGAGDHPFGQTIPQATYLHADIVLVSPDEWPATAYDDFETVLVHELLHVLFSTFEPEEGVPEFDRATHQVITSLARSFVRVDRDAN